MAKHLLPMATETENIAPMPVMSVTGSGEKKMAESRMKALP